MEGRDGLFDGRTSNEHLRGPLITPFANGGASYSGMEYPFGNTWLAIL
jgi:hypothetical protein